MIDGTTPPKSVRVLVVDDLREIRQLLRMVLESWGYEVVEAADGAEALEAVRSQTYALAIVDVNLPDCDGMHLAGSIRETDLTGQIKLMCITGDRALSQQLSSGECGFDGFIMKPFGVEELLERVSEVCGKDS
jgi:DNA-binding response OmpR family regulator